MSNIFCTADLHFGHDSLCKGLRNMSAKESDELIIENWNKTVNQNDIVYLLGDFMSEDNPLRVKDYLIRLNGDIILVAGNHDNISRCREFRRMGFDVVGSIFEDGFIMTHIPIVFDPTIKECFGNIHGHIHSSGFIEGYGEYNPTHPIGNYINVNMEFCNYKPVSFEELKKNFRKN